MKKFYQKVVQFRIPIMIAFLILSGLGLYTRTLVKVDYDMSDYLPENSLSTTSLDLMEEEFDGDIPNARVMVKDVTVKEAMNYKEQIKEVDGVESITWLDDQTEILDIYAPLSLYDSDTVEEYYKDDCALFTVTIEEDKRQSAVEHIRTIVGDDNCMTGSAVSTAVATTSTVDEINTITIIAVIFVFFVLLVTTTSWIEPILVMIGLGVAILLNAGSNLMFGTISFVSNAAGPILQLAVSLDYSVFLIHRFEELSKEYDDPNEAMVEALVKSTSSIASSGLTTVIGFAALIMMQFQIGPDMGLVLAKGVAISLITVFLFMPGMILIFHNALEKTKHKDFMPKFHTLGNAVTKGMIPIAVIALVLSVPSFFLSSDNNYYYGSSHIFSTGTQYGDDTKEIQDLFGKNDKYVLMIPTEDLGNEKVLATELEKLDGVSSVTDLTTILGYQYPNDILPGGITGQLESDAYRRMVIQVNVDYEGEETFALVEKIESIANQYYGDTYKLAGEGISTYDLMTTITRDMEKVNLVAIAAVFLILLLTEKNLLLPIILVLVIETAVWINFSIPHFTGQTIFYLSYLIISSIQLGATVDYAILFSERYLEERETYDKKRSVQRCIEMCTGSILTSGTVMTVIGLLLGKISTHGILSQLGTFLGIGTICSMILVLFALPGLLYLFDRFIVKQKK